VSKLTYVIVPGNRFGRGVVIAEIRVPDSRRPNGRRGARLICDCGTVYEARLGDLTKKVQPTRSCGCLCRDTAQEHGQSQANLDRLAVYARSPEGRTGTAAANRAAKTVHGMAKHDGTQHPLYGIWSNMMSRCYNANVRSYRDYGARGITVCDRWHDVRLFVADIENSIGPRPSGMTLDRIQSTDNYAPGKVRWATRAEQNRNSRQYIDGQRSGPVYQLWWRLMRQRSDEVCADWHDFTQFANAVRDLLGPRSDGMGIVRIDPARPYQAGNLRWQPAGRPRRKG